MRVCAPHRAPIRVSGLVAPVRAAGNRVSRSCRRRGRDVSPGIPPIWCQMASCLALAARPPSKTQLPPPARPPAPPARPSARGRARAVSGQQGQTWQGNRLPKRQCVGVVSTRSPGPTPRGQQPRLFLLMREKMRGTKAYASTIVQARAQLAHPGDHNTICAQV